MDIATRMDADHAAVLAQMPAVDLTDITGSRSRVDEYVAATRTDSAWPRGVTATDRTIPGTAGGDDVPIRIFRREAGKPLPALLWIHSGGMVLGSIDWTDPDAAGFAAAADCAVVTVDYRLAPEHPFPAGLEDCYSVLAWVASNADALQVVPGRLAVGGPSAGGGLAASLALLARDRGEVALSYQLLVYPMLDDRNTTPSSHEVTHPNVWNREQNMLAWDLYLEGAAGSDSVTPYAAPNRATDLSGLPPAHISVGDLDLFRDEDIDYAQRLAQAGVATDLRVYAGSFHGSDGFVPDSPVSQTWVADRNAALRRALHTLD
jgi:acetyl esterase/lipase